MSIWRLIELNAINLLVIIFAANLLCTFVLALVVRRMARRNAYFVRALQRHAALLEGLMQDLKQDARADSAVKPEVVAAGDGATPVDEIPWLPTMRREIEFLRAELNACCADDAFSTLGDSQVIDAERLIGQGSVMTGPQSEPKGAN
jgi:hypothetical protein